MIFSKDASRCWKKICAREAKVERASLELGRRWTTSCIEGLSEMQMAAHFNAGYANDKESFKNLGSGKPAWSCLVLKEYFLRMQRFPTSLYNLFYLITCHVQIYICIDLFLIICFRKRV